MLSGESAVRPEHDETLDDAAGTICAHREQARDESMAYAEGSKTMTGAIFGENGHLLRDPAFPARRDQRSDVRQGVPYSVMSLVSVA